MSKNTLPLEERVGLFYQKYRPISLSLACIGLISLFVIFAMYNFRQLSYFQMSVSTFGAILLLLPAVILGWIGMLYGGIKR